jgi:hypothetical protein
VFDRRQTHVLADRYLESLLADRRTALLWLVAPVAALATVAAVRGFDLGGETTRMVMASTVCWLGVLDGHREIDRAWVRLWRERASGLALGSLLYSKVRTLVLMGSLQVVAYASILYFGLDSTIPIGWLVVVLLATLTVGIGMGLALSALAVCYPTATRFAHPLAWLQILALAPVAPDLDFSWTYHLVPLRWSAESLALFSKVAHNLRAAAYLLPLLGFALSFIGLAGGLVARWTSRGKTGIVPGSKST